MKVTSCAICGSDLRLSHHVVPGMNKGDVMGHEFMGEVVEVGREVKDPNVGDRVVVPFTIICGEGEQGRRGYYSVCETTNRNKKVGDPGGVEAARGRASGAPIPNAFRIPEPLRPLAG